MSGPHDSGSTPLSYPPPDPGSLAPPPAGPEEPYAHWWRRVVATVLDSLLPTPFVVVATIAGIVARDPGSGSMTHLGGLLVTLAAYLGYLVFAIWNTIVRQGRRGASIGKSCVGILVLSAHDGRPIGGVPTFVRQVAHLVDYLPLGVGFLWPLWDRRRQTFADKIMNTAVLYLPDVRF